MKRLRATFALLALMSPSAALAAAPAAASEAPPLRHMVFAITIGIRTLRTTQGSGIGTETGTNASSTGIEGVGTITADVIMPTRDGGLILNISEDAQDRKAPVVRVAVRGTGEVLTPPDANVTAEERILLRYLARSIVALATPTKGATWDYDSNVGGAKIHTTFRVIDARDNGSIDIDVNEDMAGAGGTVAGTTHGRVIYDTKKVVPDKLDMSSRIRQEGVGGLVTTTITFVADLREDSFAKE